jgi:hypothetical protein
MRFIGDTRVTPRGAVVDGRVSTDAASVAAPSSRAVRKLSDRTQLSLHEESPLSENPAALFNKPEGRGFDS